MANANKEAKAAELVAVFSHPVAICSNRLGLLMNGSILARSQYKRFKNPVQPFAFFGYGLIGVAPCWRAAVRLDTAS